jgi:hypothetical protein
VIRTASRKTKTEKTLSIKNSSTVTWQMNRFLGIFILLISMGSSGILCQAQQPGTQLSEQQFQFERALEQRKFNLEIFKSLLTAASIAVPLLIGFYAIHRQVKTAFELKEVEAKNSFELKAAEILLNSKTPGQLHNKAKVLLKLFPKAPLPSEFTELVKSFNPNEFTGPSIEWKVEFFKIVVANYDRKESIIELWRQVFPGDEWIERFETTESAPAIKNGP